MITKEDLVKYVGFKKVLNETKIELKWDAVRVAASLAQWFDELGPRMQQHLQPQKPIQMIGEIKPIEEKPKKKRKAIMKEKVSKDAVNN